MKVLIVEDEHRAAKRMEQLLLDAKPNAQIIRVIDSVEDTVHFFEQNEAPDLVFMDIQLADGLSFDIFTKVQIESPIIFTTAYDEYAIQAFKVNSVDYLLKPIDEEELAAALQKFEQLHYKKPVYNKSFFTDLLKSISQENYTQRFLIKTGQSFNYVGVEEIAYFFSDQSLSFIQTKLNKKYALDYTMDQLEDLINPEQFFRINRKLIVHIESIEKISSYFNNRLIINLKPKTNLEAIVTRERVKKFKKWLGS